MIRQYKISFIAMYFLCSYNKILQCVVMSGRRTSMFTWQYTHMHQNDFDKIYYYFKLNI